MAKKTTYDYSKFWLGNDFDADAVDFNAMDLDSLLKLASWKRSIANFVRILTNKDIPVKYNSGTSSYTTGEVVVISADLDSKKFDSAVGTALHEGSHVLLTEMQMFKPVVLQYIITDFWNSSNMAKAYGYTPSVLVKGLLHELHRINSTITAPHLLADRLKSIFNWVEDRRIDYYVFTRTPGYKGYYHAMYDEYFRSNAIDAGLRSKKYARTETYESYKFRLYNLMNVNTDLDALKGLREIAEILNLNNIGRTRVTRSKLRLLFL
jgi:hypothetical protein